MAAIIPARNEASTIGEVVSSVFRCSYIDELLVVDNGSTDDTAEIATAAGARVVYEERRGKGQAIKKGVCSTEAEVLLFLDADLVGLTPAHITDLVRPVLFDQADMVCGLFDRGRFLNVIFLHFLPILTGERALRRYVFESLEAIEISGYRLEFALNTHVKYHRLRRFDFVCNGMSHRPKEHKLSNPLLGFLAKQAMLLEALTGYFVYLFRRGWFSM